MALLPYPSTLFIFPREHGSHLGAQSLLSKKISKLWSDKIKTMNRPLLKTGGAYFYPNTPVPGTLRVYCDDFVLVSGVRLRLYPQLHFSCNS